MRVSSLSDERIIELASRYFVPAWISRDRYQLDKVDKDEQKLIARIDASRREQRLEGGAVCVYIVDSTGRVLATLPVQKAYKPDLLTPFLKKIVADEKLTRRGDIKAVATPEKFEPKGEDGRLFAVRTRFDGRENRGTSRDIVELTKAEWSGFLPPKPRAGQTWKLPAKTAEKLLSLAYPPLPNWEAKLVKLERAELTATVTEVKDGKARIRLEGKVELIYPYKRQPTDGQVTAKLIGLVRAEGEKLEAVELTSDEGMYRWSWQGKEQPKPMSLAIELLP